MNATAHGSATGSRDEPALDTNGEVNVVAGGDDPTFNVSSTNLFPGASVQTYEWINKVGSVIPEYRRLHGLRPNDRRQ